MPIFKCLNKILHKLYFHKYFDKKVINKNFKRTINKHIYCDIIKYIYIHIFNIKISINLISNSKRNLYKTTRKLIILFETYFIFLF